MDSFEKMTKLWFWKSYVREAGVSVYSCSPIAAEDLPDFKDPGQRSAISLGRRILNPVGELVKVAPESLGIGQYQHDIPNKKLEESLSQVVEECVRHGLYIITYTV